MGLTLGWGTKILHAEWQKKKKKNHYTNILNVFNVLLSSKLNLKKKKKKKYPDTQSLIKNTHKIPEISQKQNLNLPSVPAAIYIASTSRDDFKSIGMLLLLLLSHFSRV
ncbi:unnamed protein product [Rangifer tarandus platyrhynchus]|uniref:Uncharacterized protein n=2 Tax=Rangifer tarandus platyrhynchus TaxID=3082113 RepID=A0AC59ZRM9_RANTA|nr:unnamed protein product [Rangifer tarandus platyrhynchus]